MAPTEHLQNSHVPLLHFIIALMLVKSKPRSLSSPGEAGDHLKCVTVSHRNVTDFCKQLVLLIKEGPRSKMSSQADAHIDTTAFWRNRSNKLEEEHAALEAKVSRLQQNNTGLQAKIAELEAGKVAPREKSTEVESSARSQRLKRRKDREPGEGPSGRSTKRARTKAGEVVPNERVAVIQSLVDDETRSELDELGPQYFPLQHLSLLTRQGTTF